MAEVEQQPEVHFQEPRHYHENPLLMVICKDHPEEWYFEVQGNEMSLATARCRVEFRDRGKPPHKLGATSEVPKEVKQAVLDYDGQYAVDYVRNPTADRPMPWEESADYTDGSEQ